MGQRSEYRSAYALPAKLRRNLDAIERDRGLPIRMHILPANPELELAAKIFVLIAIRKELEMVRAQGWSKASHSRRDSSTLESFRHVLSDKWGDWADYVFVSAGEITRIHSGNGMCTQSGEKQLLGSPLSTFPRSKGNVWLVGTCMLTFAGRKAWALSFIMRSICG